MGHLEDNENCKDNNSTKNDFNIDLSDIETQQIDSQFSPGGFLEDYGADDSPYLTDTLFVDDTNLLEDAFETQLVNLAGETQVVDLDGETQVVDLVGETQMVDLAGETQVLDDLDCMNIIPNELNADVGDVNEFDVKHKAACETQVLSQDDSWRTDDSYSVGLENKVQDYHPKQGSVCRGFTSIRTASIRASGLAARARGANRTSSDKSSVEQKTCEQDGSSLANDQECLQNEYNECCRELKGSNKCAVGNRAMRKLFGEDKVAEDGHSEADDNHTDPLDIPELPAENCLAGLSYANSQEPGELSQAYALEVVDKFLYLNAMECDEGFGTRIHKAEKPKVASVGKGSRDLAKSSTLKSADGERGIYDWDDTHEDDGGGEFFMKKKELFFDKGGPKQSCFTETRKHKCPDLGSVKAVGDDDEIEQNYTRSKLGDSVCSDSGLHKLRTKRKSLYCGEKGLHKNLMKDLDEQVKVVSGPKLADEVTDKDVTDKDVPDMSIGPDTQMAAEAMETLCFEVSLPDDNSNDPSKGAHSTAKAARINQSINTLAHSEHLTSKLPHPATDRVVTRQAKQIKRTIIDCSNESSLPPKQLKKHRKRRDTMLREAEQSRLAHHGAESASQRSEEKHHLGEQPEFPESVAHRTRKCTESNCLKADGNASDAWEKKNDVIGACVLRKRRTAAKNKNAVIVTIQQLKKVGSAGFKQLNKTSGGTASASNTDSVDNPRGKRSCQEMLCHEADTQYNGKLKRSREVAASVSSEPGRKHPHHTSTCNGPALSSLDQSKKILSARNDAVEYDSNHVNMKASLNDAVDASKSNHHQEKNDAETSSEGAETNGRLEAPPGERYQTSSPACATPAAACATTINNVSPICMGDEYHKQSCRKSLSRFSLIKELNNLVTSTAGPSSEMKETRKRKDITNIGVLFSQHLDLDVVKHQKKILARLGGAVASSMSDATHFVADEFVRTRNMLEAIASGKPVVTHLWLESCGEASCLIDEKNYVLRDAKKEREFGFSLPVSLSRASQHPLLQGQKVFVTPNTKPGKDILANLVKAVHGLAVERLGRSALKDEKLPDDLLILSCEEDYDVCVPYLEKGGAVYSSELLLNGIVKQKLEYERHRLFGDHVKRTRSTIWVKKKNRYLPVTKSK